MAGLFETDEAIAGYARVAVERGVDAFPEGLTYAVPESMSDLAPGERVIVPLGRRGTPTAGYVVEVGDTVDLAPDLVKTIERRDALSAPLPPGLLQLATWVSRYYCTPIGMTLATMLPAAVKRRVGVVKRVSIDLADPPGSDATPGSRQQRSALETLAALPPRERPIDIRKLADRAGLRTTGPIRRLLDAGLVRRVDRTAVEAAWSEHATDARTPERPTDAQQLVVNAVGGVLDAGFSVHLLFGVTGSGKTEVYIRLIDQVIRAGRTALLLVPEIALTPQTGGRLMGRFPGCGVAVLHSGLTAAQRHQQWARTAAGEASIVLGARSAVFAPIPDGRLGLIVVDEEHDASYKQDQAPRYHGRDVAIRRAQLAACPIVLGSATPSLESWHRATVAGGSTLHRLDERVPGATLPEVRIVDTAREQAAEGGRGFRLIGPTLERGIGDTLDADRQVLLLLNRRGFASFIACTNRGCGWMLRCDHCDVTMVYHRDRSLPAGGFVRCHHCLTEQRLPAACPACSGRITTFGLGTQRVEDELTRLFPGLEVGRNVLRIDSDTMHRARDFHDALERFGAGDIRVLVGTQMIAKGLDYPRVRLVGVISADTAINLPDFRATERTFQLVSQVAGRCGRGTDAGRVIVQTFDPDTQAIQLAARHDYPAFANNELRDRHASELPPFSRLTRIVLRDEDLERGRATAESLAASLRALATPGLVVQGPIPCPIARIAGRHRMEILLRAPDAGTMQRHLTDARNRGLLRSGAAMAVDVDPTGMM